MDDLVKRLHDLSQTPAHKIDGMEAKELAGASKDRIKKLEAKLAKAVEAAFNEGFLAGTADGWVNNPRIKMEWKRSRAKATLAELKGQDDG